MKAVKLSLISSFVCLLFLSSLQAQGTAFSPEPLGETSTFSYQPHTGEYTPENSLEKDPGAYLGVMVRNTDKKEGVTVLSFLDQSPAREAGIPEGAVLLTLDGEKIESVEALLNLLKSKNPGDKVKIRYRYDDKAETATVTLAERPADFDNESEEFVIRERRTERRGDGRGHIELERRSKGSAPWRGKFEKELVIEREGPEPFFHGRPHKQSLDIPEIGITRRSTDGVVKIALDGLEGPLDVSLLKADGSVFESVVIEEMKGPFEHEFTLGPGAQGRYTLVITQGEKSYREHVRF